MPVSSLIIQADPKLLDEVRNAINELNGASVTRVEGASLVTITETTTKSEDKSLWEDFERIPGVISVNLIYHNFEDLEEREQ